MRILTATVALLMAAVLSAEVYAADSANVRRQNAIRQELLEHKQILERALAHNDSASIHFYLAECEFGLGNFAESADRYAQALLSPGSSDDQRLKSRQALTNLGKMGFRSAFDTNPPPLPSGARPLPRRRSPGRIQIHHDELAKQIESQADLAAEQKQMYFTRAITDIERKLDDDIKHLARSSDDRQSSHRSEISELTRVARDRQEKLRYQLQKSLEGISRQRQRKLDNLKHSASALEAQTHTDSGAVGLVPGGTSLHVRNYINFPDVSESDRYAPPTVPVRAAAGKWTRQSPNSDPVATKSTGK